MSRWLEYETSLTLSAEIDPARRPKHLFDLPSADVAIVAVDARDPDRSVELALELQAKDRGTGIILVLSGLGDDTARKFGAYSGSWSLVTSRTSSDPVKLAFVARSAARGIPVVEPAVSAFLRAGLNGRAVEDDHREPSLDFDLASVHKAA